MEQEQVQGQERKMIFVFSRGEVYDTVYQGDDTPEWKRALEQKVGYPIIRARDESSDDPNAYDYWIEEN